MSFYTGTQCEVLYALNAAVTKNTYTTQAVLSAAAAQPKAVVPAGFWASNPNGIGRTLLLEAAGTIANTAAATFTLALAMDPTAGTVSSQVITVAGPTFTPTAAVTSQWWLRCIIMASAVGGSTGLTLAVSSDFKCSIVASGTMQTTTDQFTQLNFSSAMTAVNAEVQNFVELCGTWSASSASNTTTLQQFLLLGLN